MKLPSPVSGIPTFSRVPRVVLIGEYVVEVLGVQRRCAINPVDLAVKKLVDKPGRLQSVGCPNLIHVRDKSGPERAG